VPPCAPGLRARLQLKRYCSYHYPASLTRVHPGEMFTKQFFSERVDAMLWSLQLNHLAVPDPGGFWNTTLPYFRRLLILNSLRSKHKAHM
jgi:hypothetical protein